MWKARQDRQEKRARRLQSEEEERAAEQSGSCLQFYSLDFALLGVGK